MTTYLTQKSFIEATELETIAAAFGVTFGSEALIATGVQHEFAAHMARLCADAGCQIILRAGGNPVYDKPGVAKYGTIKTKSSKLQGFLNGYLAVEDRFSRVVINSDGSRNTIGVHNCDYKNHYEIEIQDNHHLFAKQLSVRMSDIAEQLGTAGDLELVRYDQDKKELVFKFKIGKGDPNFKGQFVIKLADEQHVRSVVSQYTRPWLGSEDIQIAQHTLLREKLGESFDLNQLINKEFDLFYQITPDHHELEPVKVMAGTPKTVEELIGALDQAIKQLIAQYGSEPAVITADTIFITALMNFREQIISTKKDLEQALELIGAENLKRLYELTSKYVVSDWDGLALGMPCNLKEEYKTVYNTFSDDPLQVIGLVEKTKQLFEELRNEALLAKLQIDLDRAKGTKYSKLTRLQELLITTKFDELRNIFLEKRAGIVTPFEFLMQQILNYSYKLPDNRVFGEKPQLGIMHPAHDMNVHNLFQHGWDFRSPYGVEADGGWLLITNDGVILAGQNHTQLVAILLAENGKLLRNSFFEINSAMDFRPSVSNNIGWCDVVLKQIELGQPVTPATMQALRAAEQAGEEKDKPLNIVSFMYNRAAKLRDLFPNFSTFKLK